METEPWAFWSRQNDSQPIVRAQIQQMSTTALRNRKIRLGRKPAVVTRFLQRLISRSYKYITLIMTTTFGNHFIKTLLGANFKGLNVREKKKKILEKVELFEDWSYVFRSTVGLIL